MRETRDDREFAQARTNPDGLIIVPSTRTKHKATCETLATARGKGKLYFEDMHDWVQWWLQTRASSTMCPWCFGQEIAEAKATEARLAEASKPIGWREWPTFEGKTERIFLNAEGIVTRGPAHMVGKDLSAIFRPRGYAPPPPRPQAPPPHANAAFGATMEQARRRRLEDLERSSRFSAPPSPPAPPTALEQAFETLHLLPGTPLPNAEAAYRAAMKVAHPDVGGTDAQARRLTQAIETIRTHSQQQRLF